MRKYLTIVLLPLILGCTSALVETLNSVSIQYAAVVFDDGISLEEAKTIAQNELVDKNLVKIYDLAVPKEKKDILELPHYQDYWFVFFEERAKSHIKFIFMALIDKKTGRVKYANDYPKDRDWILEAALLR